ncbi:MAG: sigma factor-like helix-turn-helix DNA-binding protein [Melioribacteraceae bacterium]
MIKKLISEQKYSDFDSEVFPHLNSLKNYALKMTNDIDDFRTIVFLSDIEGYSYKEISEFIDCPIGTVRSRLHRTRKILYALLYRYALSNSYVTLKTKKENHEQRS